MGIRRPAGADDVNSLEGRWISRLPVFQLIGKHGKEILLRRIPWLHQVVRSASLLMASMAADESA